MNKYLKEYIELLQYAKSLEKDGTNLRKEDPDKYLKLLKYGVKLSDHVHWQQKRDYLNIMKNFVDLKIDGEEFESQFDKLHRSNEKTVQMLARDNLKQLNPFELNPQSFGFTRWTSDIDLACDEFHPDLKPQDRVDFAFARDEEDLRAFVADILPEIQKYF